MPYRLIHESIIPRGGWAYLEPKTGVWLHGDDFFSLVAQVRAHREFKGIQIDTLVDDVTTQVCQRLGPAACTEWDEYYPDKTDQLSQELMFSFNSAVLEFLKGGLQTVDATEASRRAEICRRCPFNKSTKTCSCSLFYKALNAALPASMKDPSLQVCSVCGCSLQAKVWMPENVINASSSGTAFPSHCWQKDLVG